MRHSRPGCRAGSADVRRTSPDRMPEGVGPADRLSSRPFPSHSSGSAGKGTEADSLLWPPLSLFIACILPVDQQEED